MTQGGVPRRRLNEIARRKLLQLGITATLPSEGEALRGEIAPRGALINPFTRTPIDQATFIVEGHDHLRFLAPPLLAGLKPQHFYDKNDLAELFAALASVLQAKVVELKRLAAALRNARIESEIDGERGIITAKIEMLPNLGTVLIEGDARGLFAMELIPPEGPMKRAPQPLHCTLIPFAHFGDRVDLEIFLSRIVEEAAVQQREAPKPVDKTGWLADSGVFELMLATGDLKPTSTPLPQVPVAAPLPPGSLTLKLLLEKLGESALLGAGVVVARELSAGGKRVRFEAKHKEGLTFVGRVSSGDSTIWSEAFNLEGFPGVDRFVEILLGVEGPAEPEPSKLATGPGPGEIWTMRVVVEREDAEEVRYVALDPDGKPYGAARVLAKSFFREAFGAHAGGFVFAVRILAVDRAHVSYVRLDNQRRPADQPKTVPLAVFTAQFVRER